MARKWWTLTAVCAGVFMLLLDVTIVSVALPAIERGFSVPLSDLEWVISAYALTLAAFLLTAGSLADRFGRRRMFAIGLGAFTSASLLCGLASDATFLIIARGVQGVGGAIMFATSLALLADAFRGRERGVAFGVFGAVTGAAVAVGPVVGGGITTGLSWRWIFFVNLPIGVAALSVTLLRVAESRSPHATTIDLPGFVTFTCALAALVVGLINSSADGWSAVPVIAPLAAAAALLCVFVIIEARSDAPMLDLHLLQLPAFDGGLVAAFAISASIFSLLIYLVLYLQNYLGLSPLGAGLRVLPLSLAIFASAGVAGRLTVRVPRRLLIGSGFGLVGAGLLLMSGLTTSSGWAHLLPGMIVAGLGAGLVNVPLASTAVGVVEPARAGVASGINSTLRQVGIAAGVAALGSIFAASIQSAVTARLIGTALRSRASELAHAVSTGGAASAIASTPAPLRGLIVAAGRSAFVSGLDLIMIVGAVVAFAGSIGSLALIRERDFVATTTAEPVEGLMDVAS
ncbi:MAG: MFS transporter [Candidatus Dormibacteria bacterium]|jgi:EmrB/QacA subfamily drug resistance transporter